MTLKMKGGWVSRIRTLVVEVIGLYLDLDSQMNRIGCIPSVAYSLWLLKGLMRKQCNPTKAYSPISYCTYKLEQSNRRTEQTKRPIKKKR